MVALLNYVKKKLHNCGIYCTNNDNNSYKNDQRLFNVKTLKVNIHWGRLRVSQHIRSVRPLWTWEQLLPCDGFVSCVLFCPNWLRYCNEVAKSVHPQCKLIWTVKATCENRDCTCADASFAECSESPAHTPIHTENLEECIFQCEVPLHAMHMTHLPQWPNIVCEIQVVFAGTCDYLLFYKSGPNFNCHLVYGENAPAVIEVGQAKVKIQPWWLWISGLPSDLHAVRQPSLQHW